jgi:hypothetical protein
MDEQILYPARVPVGMESREEGRKEKKSLYPTVGQR